ncbi:DUF5916 domain-containing protein [Candidatus Palauibacter sp.]|uniref:carbohydrate binding family 9 domain-containing protein n=1 Tax=Candidatus Palauibacter sp. TaxID=3101350 RepID=UPI003B0232F8
MPLIHIGRRCRRLATSCAWAVPVYLLAAPGLAAQTGATDEADAAALRSPVPVPIPRLAGEIDVDGVVDEPAWEAIEPLPMFMWAPTHGGEMTERTEVRIAHDDEYLYLSGRMYDSNPDGIRANTYLRDAFSGDDLLSFVIDSYNDYETGAWLGTTPAGVRQDRSLSNDGDFTGDVMPFNVDWNAHWQVVTSRNDEGWFAEYRVPFSSLGFQAQGDEVTMGVIVYRFIARKNERHVFPFIGREWGQGGFLKPSQGQRMTLRGVRPATPAYVTPYVLGGLSRTPVLREPSDAASFWGTERDQLAEPGVDLKYSPSSNLAIDLTVNTDFAQVEADDQQVNLTRFSLFFPEKRQFFQERSSTFDFGTGGFTDRVFFSRRIGLERGELVRIYGGARLVGRIAGLDFGVLNMQTAPAAGRSGENMGVMRLKQQVLNPYSFVGGILTTRYGSNGRNNVAYGLDSQLRLFGDEYLTVTWAQTQDEVVRERNVLDASLVRARWERRTDRGVSYNLFYRRVGPDYLPRLGFQLRNDFTLFGGEFAHTWLRGADATLNGITLALVGENYQRNVDLTLESRSIRPEVRLDFKSTANITAYSNVPVRGHPQAVPGRRRLHPARRIPVSRRSASTGQLPRSTIVRGEIRTTAGSFYDGRRVGLIFNPTWTDFPLPGGRRRLRGEPARVSRPGRGDDDAPRPATDEFRLQHPHLVRRLRPVQQPRRGGRASTPASATTSGRAPTSGLCIMRGSISNGTGGSIRGCRGRRDGTS